MLSAYSRLQPSPSSASITLSLTDSRSSACIAVITSCTGFVVNLACIFSSTDDMGTRRGSSYRTVVHRCLWIDVVRKTGFPPFQAVAYRFELQWLFYFDSHRFPSKHPERPKPSM